MRPIAERNEEILIRIPILIRAWLKDWLLGLEHGCPLRKGCWQPGMVVWVVFERSLGRRL